ncbi:MAG: hypothetical protein ACFE68_05135 [Candidatus Hodarchaeota archaeon]
MIDEVPKRMTVVEILAFGVTEVAKRQRKRKMTYQKMEAFETSSSKTFSLSPRNLERFNTTTPKPSEQHSNAHGPQHP